MTMPMTYLPGFHAMALKAAWCLLVASVGMAPAFTRAGTPPPEVLAPYIHDGVFEPGDYAWLKGRFPDASPQSKEQSHALYKWLSQCRSDEQIRLTRELVLMGVEHPQLPPAPYQDELCDAVSAVYFDYRWPSFQSFAQDLKEATPIADAFLWAVKLASDEARPASTGLAQSLRDMPLGEQVLRYGMIGLSSGASRGMPTLTPGIRAIVRMRINRAIHHADHANTEALKAIVQKQGWPARSAVGDVAGEQIWLIVQHADRDPVFQWTVLRLMEPMVATGDVSKADYAYLYDRVMLKLAGKQRYATQSTCKHGVRVALPLEDEQVVDRRRREVGLPSMADYMVQMDQRYGACPSS
jgi:hypothetical protein